MAPGRPPRLGLVRPWRAAFAAGGALVACRGRRERRPLSITVLTTREAGTYSIGRTTLFLEARYCRVPRVLDEGRYYKGTFYHAHGIQVQQVGLTTGIRFGRE